MLKRITRSRPVQWLIARIIALYMHLVRLTTRWTIIGEENVKPIWEGELGMVLCFWHSRIMTAATFWPLPPKAQPMLMMVSQSRDGQIIATASEVAGYPTARGSSARQREDGLVDKGALQAVRALINHAKSGKCAAITPDGPRGPRMRVQAGSTRIAKSANVPMIPATAAVENSKYTKSWDRFVLPPLFSKGVIIYGAPIWVENNDDEAARLALENSLNEITLRAEAMVGGPLIEPAAIEPVANPNETAS